MKTLKIQNIQRLRTWDFASKFAIKKAKIDIVYNINQNKKKYDKEYQVLGVWTREQLISLGPTFIKLGQIASSRQDIFNENLINELISLQDECPAIEDCNIKEYVNKELNIPFERIFEKFEEKPYKAASIGQVHQAILKNGVNVIVKIQRPGIDKIIKQDLKNIREIFEIFSYLKITKSYDMKLLDESERYLIEEIDYENEAKNAKIFRKNFYKTKCKIPRICDKYSTKKILVMEYIEGVKITEIENEEDKKKAVKIIIKTFLKQLIEYGVIHGDPHPGNVAYRDSMLILYDFGLTIDISELIQNSFDDIILSLIQKDSKKLTKLLIASKLIIPTTNQANIVFFFDNIFQMVNMNKEEELFEESVETLNELGFSDTKRPFSISNDLIYIGKSLTLLDGICRKLDPDYKPLKIIKPYLEEKVDNNITLGSLSGVLEEIVEIPSKIKNMNTSIIEIEKTSYSTRNRTKLIKKDLKNLQFLVFCIIIYLMYI